MTSADDPASTATGPPAEVALRTDVPRWDSGAVVIRRSTAAYAGVPDVLDAPPLTEAQVSGGSPVARLVNAHPWVSDATVAVLIVLAGLVGAIFAWEAAVGARYLGLYPSDSGVEHTVAATWLTGVLGGAALLLLRRVLPLTVTALLTAACVASLVVGGVLGILGACVGCALYSVAAARGPRTTWTVFGAVLVVLTVASWRWEELGFIEIVAWFGVATSSPWDPVRNLSEPPHSPASRTATVMLLLVLLLLGVAVGSAARARRLHAQELVERYRALARERDQSAALARAAERAHIAREMHDVVAHNVSVMVTLADGADAAFERAPDQSRDAVRQIARTGRSALVDMQGVLGVLGPTDGHDDRRAEPTEVDLPTLVDRFGSAGVPVTATGLDTDLPDDTSVRLAVLRILGEALTNVLRHAPGAPSVEVAVRRTPTTVEVDVVDAGGTRPGSGEGTGRGIVGMRERAALLGGHVETGPLPGGGWRVHAVLPWADEEGRRP
ncbi:sensor histidine kinase [Actinotalea sp. C106]|uniref:sensor histidine kinase n=1 Tax=Actinotalea sp. C106 TaxID=2908644 RepID=UPI002028B397|nr:histidine kinase [Actinotalea sp. C106]